ncbi:hypothetical protein SELMODRAFT_405873 [Selaginella moellendorffii]|uniref:Cystinosin homolog n=1 Tax=Selaginella moellendorffii TaxID=88036 RepID=D8QZY6_SELML|nr:cystinosin homolog [Selaginella moellendorffii]EFJ34881.1 hypothetical protein SELMODRAFT_405873 [Selaginella moellendorffii]|eukprot:XP_002964548.1 cystinosin homolog [Selaginella moellendorffii]
MASWSSSSLSAIYQILGWFAFAVWSISFYPQALLNYRRKSVVGLNFDFQVLNFTKHSSYLIYNAAVFFSPVVQRQYHDKYGRDELIPVAANDVAFSIHAVLLAGFTIVQIFLYERGGQRVSEAGVLVSLGAWLAGLTGLIVAFPSGRWLWLVQVFNIIQMVMAVIKYIPQAWMNFRRKSTVGWSIATIPLDLSGGIANILQMAVQSIDQRSTMNFSGNVGKLGISLECIAFDILFIFQHYFLYYKADKVDELDAAYYYEVLENDPEQAKTGQVNDQIKKP